MIYKILRLLDVNVRNNYFFIPAIISMSPMFKWHIYESTSMTFTFLIFIYGLLITLENKNKNITFINIGLLFLVHRSAIVIFVFFVLYNNFKNRKFSLYLNKFVLVAIPISIFYFWFWCLEIFLIIMLKDIVNLFGCLTILEASKLYLEVTFVKHLKPRYLL